MGIWTNVMTIHAWAANGMCLMWMPDLTCVTHLEIRLVSTLVTLIRPAASQPQPHCASQQGTEAPHASRATPDRPAASGRLVSRLGAEIL